MQGKETPKWLLEGAWSAYKSKRNWWQDRFIIGWILSVSGWFIVHVCFQNFIENRHDKIGDLVFFTIMYGPFIMGIILDGIKKQKVCNNEEYQKLYLQSKIDEYHDYQNVFNKELTKLQDNLVSMRMEAKKASDILSIY